MKQAFREREKENIKKNYDKQNKSFSKMNRLNPIFCHKIKEKQRNYVIVENKIKLKLK